jgi:alpha,alpha-trehalase
LCTLGNGYFATRGAGAEAVADGVHYPGTYLAGGYNRLETKIAGRVIENEDLVNMPNWLPLTFRLPESAWFSLEDVEILSYRQELDLLRGILLRTISFRDEQGRQTKMEERRLVHMGNMHLAALETRLTAENWSGKVEIRSGLDGLVTNRGVDRYKELNSDHLEPLETEKFGDDTIHSKVLTKQSGLHVAQSARTRVFVDGQPFQRLKSFSQEPGSIFQEFVVDLVRGSEIRIEKVVSFFTSRDSAFSECGLEAQSAVARADGFEGLLKSHTQAWELRQKLSTGIGSMTSDREKQPYRTNLKNYRMQVTPPGRTSREERKKRQPISGTPCRVPCQSSNNKLASYVYGKILRAKLS